jgi:sec-independent protein translocase protein TatA
MLPGPTELLIILVIVLVIFGAGKLPKVMGDLGRGVKSFKKAMDDDPKSETLPTPPITTEAPTGSEASKNV